ncbi:hypothetical protein CU044_3944 [Streptomyces sp. L-9-10]|nr:hypothetical protein CU044_3944 [Streptomyces sp. L-9-10]
MREPQASALQGPPRRGPAGRMSSMPCPVAGYFAYSVVMCGKQLLIMAGLTR